MATAVRTIETKYKTATQKRYSLVLVLIGAPWQSTLLHVTYALPYHYDKRYIIRLRKRYTNWFYVLVAHGHSCSYNRDQKQDCCTKEILHNATALIRGRMIETKTELPQLQIPP